MSINISSQQLRQMIQQSAKHMQTQVSLKQMVEFGRTPSQATLLRAAQFIHHELPIRLARRVVELENLPYNLSNMSSVKKVAEWYQQSYLDLVTFPPPEDVGLPKTILRDISLTEEDGVSKTITEGADSCPHKNRVAAYNARFVDCIENIKTRHDPVAINMAQGIQELKAHWKETKSTPVLESASPGPIDAGAGAVENLLPTDLQSFLDRFYMSRIGIRMLIGQHVALAKASSAGSKSSPDYVGIICTKTSIRDIVTQAAEHAQGILQDTMGVFSPPEIKLFISHSGVLGAKVDHAVDDVHFMYVPSHLHHCLFELFKNSLRAVVETHGLDMDGEYPPIKVIVAEGNEDITIKISDEGGGIPRSGMPLIWTYLYTTAQRQDLEDAMSSEYRAPMAGFGYGLPLSRLYLQFFGGDLKVISMEGFGTDAYLHLNRLSDSTEPLPS
ncbi:mitochondrial branched-chain alpha-ketoacid dehydrogenase kinase-domain-containing protein [Chytriomyces cf. hyalinus JEL632]|nr:mitochondrial branched-chain alpha-ketoacid dehydrogenase kinase-domain-containing protein [Chytriomyces cf. hyalinus JEL632]